MGPSAGVRMEEILPPTTTPSPGVEVLEHYCSPLSGQMGFGQWIHGVEDPLAKPLLLTWFSQPQVSFHSTLRGATAEQHCMVCSGVKALSHDFTAAKAPKAQQNQISFTAFEAFFSISQGWKILPLTTIHCKVIVLQTL